MDYLYVCEFSNGHIKVGRATDPQARIEQHTERVSCLGVTRLNSFYALCAGPVVTAEFALIEKCAEHAGGRNLNEWFIGLDFGTVCVWAAECAASIDSRPSAGWVDGGPVNFRAIVRWLMSQGVTQTQIAAHCGCHQCTVSDISKGKTTDPAYSMGVKLLALYESKV